MLIPVGVIMLALTAGDMFFPEPSIPEPEPVPVASVEPYVYVPHNLRDNSESVPVPAPVVIPEPVKITHPFSGLGLHIAAYIHSDKKTLYSISASQNGQRVFRMSDSELKQAGYSMEFLTPCLIKIKYEKYENWLTCDSPRQAVPVG
jgi:zona occludens toxin